MEMLGYSEQQENQEILKKSPTAPTQSSASLTSRLRVRVKHTSDNPLQVVPAPAELQGSFSVLANTARGKVKQSSRGYCSEGAVLVHWGQVASNKDISHVGKLLVWDKQQHKGVLTSVNSCRAEAEPTCSEAEFRVPLKWEGAGTTA